jgi:sugar/nucleoside kinase (ribokinase family)
MDDFDLLVLGDCNPDLVLSGADVRPRFGQQERLVDEARLTIGGSGAILACAAARLGLRTALAAVVGDDVLGHWMLDQLAGRGVEVGGCVVDPVRPTGLTVVLSEPGDRAILTAVGTVAALRVEDVDPARRRAARHLHVSSYYLQTALRPGLDRLFRQARREGRGTSVDPNWDPAEAWDSGLHALLPHTDCLLPNAEEAVRIAATAAPATRPVDPTGAVADGAVAAGAGAAGVAGSGAGAAAVALAAVGPLVAVKLAGAGALAAAHGGRRTVRVAVPPAAVGTVADTTGAGDSFDAGFLFGHLSGWPLDRSLALGCACGALSTRAAGGTAAQPTLDEALRTLGAGAAGLRPG